MPFRAIDEGNATPRFVRPTLHHCPASRDALNQMKVPFGIHLQPMAAPAEEIAELPPLPPPMAPPEAPVMAEGSSGGISSCTASDTSDTQTETHTQATRHTIPNPKMMTS